MFDTTNASIICTMLTEVIIYSNLVYLNLCGLICAKSLLIIEEAVAIQCSTYITALNEGEKNEEMGWFSG